MSNKNTVADFEAKNKRREIGPFLGQVNTMVIMFTQLAITHCSLSNYLTNNIG